MHRDATNSLVLLFLLIACIQFAASKMNPSDFNRNWACPNAFTGVVPPQGYLPSNPNLNKVFVNTTGLTKIAPGVAKLLDNCAVILVKRAPVSGRPYFKYYGYNQDEPHETWSASKVFSAMNGAGNLHTMCPTTGGLDQSTTGRYGRTPLGDLITIIVTYNTSYPPYSSNGLGGWFEMVGGRARAKWLAQSWMQRAKETLGGDYGLLPPTDLQFTFNPGACKVKPDTPGGGPSNTLSQLTSAEFLKRIVMARELQQEVFPNTTWEHDSSVLLYGAQNSSLFPTVKWGGMSANAARDGTDLLQAGINMTELEARSHGKWRTFSKNGAGYSSSRNAGEYTVNGYACYPNLADPSDGVEFFLTARRSVHRQSLDVAFKDIKGAIEIINKAIVEHALE